MILSLNEKFRDKFGETIEPDIYSDKVIIASANNCIALVDLLKTTRDYETFFYSFTKENLPIFDKIKKQTVVYYKSFYNYRLLRDVLDTFFKGTSFECSLTKAKEGTYFLLFKVRADTGIILSELRNKEEDKTILRVLEEQDSYEGEYEIWYRWDSCFSQQSFGDDMEL